MSLKPVHILFSISTLVNLRHLFLLLSKDSGSFNNYTALVISHKPHVPACHMSGY